MVRWSEGSQLVTIDGVVFKQKFHLFCNLGEIEREREREREFTTLLSSSLLQIVREKPYHTVVANHKFWQLQCTCRTYESAH